MEHEIFDRLTENHDAVVELRAYAVYIVRVLILVAVLVSVQMILKAVIYARVTRILRRVESLLVMIEKHGGMTDEKTQEIKRTTTQALKSVVAVINNRADEIKREVPETVATTAAAVVKTIADKALSESGTSLATAKPEPEAPNGT